MTRPDPDAMQAALVSIAAWTEAYPAKVFSEPDLAAIRAAIGDAQMSRLHASWARHLLTGIGAIARTALEVQP